MANCRVCGEHLITTTEVEQEVCLGCQEEITKDEPREEVGY